MNAPHVQLNDDGSVSLRLSAEDARVLTGHDLCKLLALQERVRPKLFVAECEASLRSEAVS
jgi:hypothetical protein